ncbi:MAG TPA: ABC transporter permease [Aggregatilineales bacterium]|nr:ABC transporter permease [Aggregatilineales bacterium]
MIEDLFTAGVFASMIRLATPYIFAGLGETFGQRSGVLNLGVDGMMLMGAFAAFYTVFETGSLILGVLAALLTGAVMGLAMAFISVTLQAEQGISGIGIYLFGLGLSELLFQRTLGTPRSVNGFPRIHFPVLSDIPVLGEIFFNHNLLVYVAFAMVPICAYILNKTTFGLQIRAVGQNPQAADAMGVSVARVRYATVTIGGIFAGLAGASLSIALLNVFQQNLTAGQGFIAVALVYFAGWRPYGILAGALLFSFVSALRLQVEATGINIPTEFGVMAPYVVTIIALVFATRRTEQPTALTQPFDRGG